MNFLKKLFWIPIVALIPLIAMAADSFIHGLTTRATPDGTEYVPVDYFSGGIWRNYKMALSSLKSYYGVDSIVNNIYTNYTTIGPNYYTSNTVVQDFFTTNIFVDATATYYFQTNIYTTNTYQTNVTIYEYLTQNSYVSNYVTTNIYNNTYNSNYFATNLFPTEYVYVTNTIGGDYIANQNGIGTNTFFRGTTTFYDLAVGNEGFASPNFFGAFRGDGSGLTNLSTTNIYQTFNVNRLTVNSNLYYLNAAATNIAWVGPTNQIDFRLGSVQIYDSWVPVSITNVIGQTNGYQNSTILCVTNKSTTNWTATVTATGWKSGRGDTLTCTNSGVIQFWFQDISGMRTLATKEYP